MTNNSKLHKFLLTFILLMPMVFALYNSGDHFVGGDEADRVLYTLQLFKGSFFSLDPLYNPIGRLLLYSYSWVHILLQAIVVMIASLFRIPLNEFIFSIPNMIETVVLVYLMYLFTRHIAGPRAALIAAGLTACLPLPVALSRSTCEWLFYYSLFLGMTYTSARYFETSSKKWGMITSVLIALALTQDWRGYVFITLFPFLGIAVKAQQAGTRFTVRQGMAKAVMKDSMCWRILGVPLILLGVYGLIYAGCVMAGYPEKGVFGRLFVRDMGHYPQPGFYIGSFSRALMHNMGPVLACITPVILLYGLRRARRCALSAYCMIWFSVFAILFLCVFAPHAHASSVEMLGLIMPLIILTAMMLGALFQQVLAWRADNTFKYFFGRSVYIGIVFMLFISGVAGIYMRVYQKTVWGWQMPPAYGSAHENCGIKTAGYYIREHAPYSARIFSREELPNALYYFNRMRTLNYIEGDFLVIPENVTPDEYGVPERYLAEQCSYVARVIFAGAPVLHIYATFHFPFKVLKTEEYDDLFDARYGTVKKLVSAPFAISQIARNRWHFEDMAPEYQNWLRAARGESDLK